MGNGQLVVGEFPQRDHVAELLNAFCSAPDWPSAAEVLARDTDVLLGKTAADLAAEMSRRFAGREFEQIPHRLSVLSRCRNRAPGDVLLELVASDVLGVLRARVMRPYRDASEAADVVTACTDALSSPTAGSASTTRAYVLQRRAQAMFQLVLTQDRLMMVIEDLARAREVLTQIAYPDHWANISHAMGEALRRLDFGDRTANIERAIAELESVLVARQGRRTIETANTLNSLGHAYSRRMMGDADENQEHADRFLREAYAIYGEVRAVKHQASTARNLAGFAVRRTDLAAYVGLLEACHWSQRAEELFSACDLPREVQRTRADLGAIFAGYARQEGVSSFYRHAVDVILSSGSDDWSELDPKDYAGSQINLGASLLALSETTEDREQAIRHFSIALDHLDESDPLGRMDAYNNRGMTYLELGATVKAAEDLRAAVELSDVALAQSELAQNEMNVVSRLDEVFGSAAVALVQLGRYSEALAIVERGRARMLTKRLAAGPMPLLVPKGEAHMLAPAGYAIVVPVIAAYGSVVFVLPPGTAAISAENIVTIKELTASDVRALAVGTQGGKAGWLMWAVEIEVAETPEEQAAAVSRFAAGIDESIAPLGAGLMARVAERLEELGVGPDTTIVLLPDGELSSMPLHAAPLAEGNTMSDRWDVIYAPSLTLFRAGLHRSKGWSAGSAAVLTISDPTGTLPFAELEVGNLEERLPAGSSRRLGPAEDLSGSYSGQAIVHIACHGVHDWRTVGRSYLQINPGQVTTADEISQLNLVGCRLAFLSACETGLTNFMQAHNEFLGLPTAFLRAGAAGVVCTLWRVDDLATTLFADRFYDEIFNGNVMPPSALRRAALWLRDVSVGELLQNVPWIVGEPRNQLKALNRDARPFRWPFYWAGFVIVGA